jgi:hypothetical protein
MKTYQEKLRSGIRWWFLKKLSKVLIMAKSWCLKKMIKLSREADSRDCLESEKAE